MGSEEDEDGTHITHHHHHYHHHLTPTLPRPPPRYERHQKQKPPRSPQELARDAGRSDVLILQEIDLSQSPTLYQHVRRQVSVSLISTCLDGQPQNLMGAEGELKES